MDNINKVEARKMVATVKDKAPALFIGLNNAQYRSLRSAYALDKAGLRPVLNIFSHANGVGKTVMAVLDMIGWTMGDEFLNAKVFPPEAIEFYRSLAPLRDKGQLSLRLLCDAEDTKAGGSVYELLNKFFPAAQLTAKDQTGSYREVRVPHPSDPLITNRISVRTFDQAIVKHAGSSLQRVWINEPPAPHILGETIGRVRSLKGGVQGSILMCATLLDSAGWVHDLEDDPSLRVNHQRGHIYENCVGEDVTDAMASEVKRTIGVTLEKKPKGGYITNGVLSCEQINAMIALWRQIAPAELEARMTGAPISGGGRIYPNFKPEVHVVDNFSVNPKWPTVFVMDPHAARPSFGLWAQVSPTGRVFIFAEWPDVSSFGRYEAIDERRYTVSQETEIFRRIESSHGLDGNSIIRLGDPNRLLEPNAFSGGTLLTEYQKYGFNFNTNINDDLTLGHEVVRSYLFYDEMRLAANPNDIVALPKLFAHKSCVNVINALKGYSMKKGRRAGSSVSENVNHRYKDAADVVRYLCVHLSQKNFAAMQDSDPSNSDWARYQRGRIPKMYRGALGRFNAVPPKVRRGV
jgi:hypothetical protein